MPQVSLCMADCSGTSLCASAFHHCDIVPETNSLEKDLSLLRGFSLRPLGYMFCLWWGQKPWTMGLVWEVVHPIATRKP